MPSRLLVAPLFPLRRLLLYPTIILLRYDIPIYLRIIWCTVFPTSLGIKERCTSTLLIDGCTDILEMYLRFTYSLSNNIEVVRDGGH